MSRDRQVRKRSVDEDAARLTDADVQSLRIEDKKILAKYCSDRSKLELLATDPDSHVRIELLMNKYITAKLLIKLSEDRDRWIRSHTVRQCKNLPKRISDADTVRTDILNRLSSDSDAVVRETVATNPHISEDLLVKLAADPDECVRRAVCMNESTPNRVLHILMDDKPSRRCIWLIGIHVNADDDLIIRACKEPDTAVRQVMASYCKRLPAEAMIILASEEDEDVWRIMSSRTDIPLDIKIWRDGGGYAGMSLQEFLISLGETADDSNKHARLPVPKSNNSLL